MLYEITANILISTEQTPLVSDNIDRTIQIENPSCIIDNIRHELEVDCQRQDSVVQHKMTDKETQTNLENNETVSLLTSNISDLKTSTTEQLLLSHALEKNHTQCDRLIEIDKTKEIVNKILVSTFVMDDNLECFSNKLVRKIM